MVNVNSAARRRWSGAYRPRDGLKYFFTKALTCYW